MSPQTEPTPFDKFREFTRKIVSVPKSEIDRRAKKYQKARQNVKRRKIHAATNSKSQK